MTKTLSDESKLHSPDQLPEKTLRNVFEDLLGDLANDFSDEKLEQMAKMIIQSFFGEKKGT